MSRLAFGLASLRSTGGLASAVSHSFFHCHYARTMEGIMLYLGAAYLWISCWVGQLIVDSIDRANKVGAHVHPWRRQLQRQASTRAPSPIPRLPMVALAAEQAAAQMAALWQQQ